MVQDRQVAGMAEALECRPLDKRMLILVDSMAAIQGVKKAGKIGEPRSRELVRVMNKVQERGKVNIKIAQVKAHVGIPSNERVHQVAKFYTKVVRPEVLTEGGIKQHLTVKRKAECAQVGWGKGQVAEWSWRAATRYTYCRTSKGNLMGCLQEIGKEDGEECRLCGEGYKDREHIVFQFEKLQRLEADRGQKWNMWKDLDDKKWIVLVEK